MVNQTKFSTGIEAFNDASIRIYQYGKGFDLPVSFAIAMKRIHTQAIDSIKDHFTGRQIKAWQRGDFEAFITFAKDCIGLYLIFDQREEIIGYALIPRAGYLWHFYIDPTHQRKGFGTKLLTVIEQNPANFDEHSVLSLKGNAVTFGFYLKHGYKIIGNEDLLMGDVQIPVKIMQKTIT